MNDMNDLIKKANQLSRENKLDEAIALYYRLIETNPNFAWAYNYLGNALIKQEKLDEAIVYYSTSVKINPNSPWFFYCLGNALANKGDLKAAAKYLQKAIEIKPNFHKFYNSLGRVLAKLGNCDEAAINYNKAIELKSKITYYNTEVSCTEPTLTIGIPTYNRCEAVTTNLINLEKSLLPKNVKILVIDNASPDNSYQKLLEIHNPETTRILRNDKNVGPARSFIELFRKCNTDYLLVTSNEDFVITEDIPNLLKFLKETSADFISPQAIINNKIYRGKQNSHPINCIDYRNSCNYLYGLTYKVNSCLSKLHKIEEYIDKSFTFAEFYLQVILAVMLVLRGVTYWYEKPICNKVFNLKSSVKYNTVNSRWNQYTSGIDIFLDLLNDPEYYSLHHQIKEMLELHLNTLKNWFALSISGERNDIPGLATYLERNDRKIDICQRNDRYHFVILN